MTDRIEREVTKEEYDAAYERTLNVMNAALDKMLGEMENQELEAGAVMSALLQHAASTAMALGMTRQFLNAFANVATRVVNHDKSADPKDDKVMIEGLKLTARVNAAVNGVPAVAMVSLMINAAISLAHEEGHAEQVIDLIRDMAKMSDEILARGPQTKH